MAANLILFNALCYDLFSVLLRQNPHNVHEWLKRVKLYDGKPQEVTFCVTHFVTLKVYVGWPGAVLGWGTYGANAPPTA